MGRAVTEALGDSDLRSLVIGFLLVAASRALPCVIWEPYFEPIPFLTDLLPETKQPRIVRAQPVEVIQRIQDPGIICPDFFQITFELTIAESQTLTIRDYGFLVSIANANVSLAAQKRILPITKVLSKNRGLLTLSWPVRLDPLPTHFDGYVTITPYSHAEVPGNQIEIRAKVKLSPNKSPERTRDG